MVIFFFAFTISNNLKTFFCLIPLFIYTFLNSIGNNLFTGLLLFYIKQKAM